MLYPVFNDASEFNILGIGKVYAVQLDQDTNDFKHLINQIVKINNKYFEVRNVERFAHCAPYKKGENIGLKVRSLTEEELEGLKI